MRPHLGAAAALLALLASCSPTRPTPSAPPPSPDAQPQPPAGAGPSPRGEGLPPVPARAGQLAIDVVYPAEGAQLTAADSNFVFGSVGRGDATLTINGQRVEVAPNGAFLAFLPVPANGVYQVLASATENRPGATTSQDASARRTVRVPVRQDPPAAGGALSFVAGSVSPRGAITAVEGEPIEVRFLATPGARARLVFPDGGSVPIPERTRVERAEGFQQDVASRAVQRTEYVGSFPARTPLRAGDASAGATRVMPLSAGTGAAYIELSRGTETTRIPLDLSLAVLPEGATRGGVAAGNRGDRTVIGQALPGSGTPYHWFFPVGTQFTVTGERAGFYRVRLTSDHSVWVDTGSVRLSAEGAPPASGTVSAVRILPSRDWVDVRLTTSERLPFRVEMDGARMTIDVYGARSRTNWLHYGVEDPWVRRAEWSQPRDDLYRVTLDLERQAWGWRSFFDESGALVIRLRRPPAIDERRPLAGLLIGVDAGHPPGGAIGPTRLTEAEANLAISKRLVRMLQEAGARVLETRPDTAAVALGDRPLMAERADVHLLVSVHNNAFPDGVNPFENAGTTAFYNAPQSMGLARAMQREIVREIGIRDLGIARADLALVRPTWFPSTLTESMFLMVPQQEAALRDPRVHERLARAHFRALEAFVREAAARR
jgi:N-acetylmuramoyl-L-alanine amidase